MSLSSSQLDALSELAKSRSFSKAAKGLAITQSALSQRIAKLEEELGASLLVREPRGIRLTPAGERLLRYCQARAALEADCLAGIQDGGRDTLAGILRIGGYSTVMRSLVLPAISPLLRAHPRIGLELLTREIGELPALLRSGEADFVLLDKPAESAGVESQLLGHEQNVLIEPKAGSAPKDIFLDHDHEDQTTFRFLELQRRKPGNLRRVFLDEIYGIIDGVAAGMGRAVAPLHLVRGNTRVRIVPRLEPLLIPVYLHCHRQPFRTRLQDLALRTLVKEVALRLRAVVS